MDNAKKDDLVNELIVALSKEVAPKGFDDLTLRFAQIYKDGYRHSYSNMYGAIADINEANNLDFLSENIELFRSHIDGLDDGKICAATRKGIYKFIDHVSLECSRMGYLNVIQNKYAVAKSDYDKITKNTDALNTSIDNIERKVNNQNKDILSHMITVVSIFTAVVFTALTSFNLISSIASAVVKSHNYYWVGCVLALVAFITINIFYVLLKFIGKLVDKVNITNKWYIIVLDAILGICIILLFVLTNVIK